MSALTLYYGHCRETHALAADGVCAYKHPLR